MLFRSMIVSTKKDAKGNHAANTVTGATKNFIGYTNKTLAKTTGYYNELTDRLVCHLDQVVDSSRVIIGCKPATCLCE